MLILILFYYHEIVLHLSFSVNSNFYFLVEDIFNTVPQKEVFIINVYVLYEKFRSTSIARGLTLNAVLMAMKLVVLLLRLIITVPLLPVATSTT